MNANLNMFNMMHGASLLLLARAAYEARDSLQAVLYPLGRAHVEEASGRCVTEDQAGGSARFLDGTYTNHAGTRNFKLYVPSGYHGQALPLVVMLHGCKQDPDDFADGARMNALAEEQQCLVVYPEQTWFANGYKCWNWFKAVDQQRDQGEPSLIAGITRQIIDTYHVDTQRVYIAGLSSGGSMAVIMGTTYPDLYVAIGVHSGLAYAGAHDLYSAIIAMRIGARVVLQHRDHQVASMPACEPFRRSFFMAIWTPLSTRTTAIMSWRNTRSLAMAASCRLKPNALWSRVKYPMAMRTRAPYTRIDADAALRNNGWCMAPVMRGRAAATAGRSPIPRAPTRHAKCCVFSMRSRGPISVNDLSVLADSPDARHDRKRSGSRNYMHCINEH